MEGKSMDYTCIILPVTRFLLFLQYSVVIRMMIMPKQLVEVEVFKSKISLNKNIKKPFKNQWKNISQPRKTKLVTYLKQLCEI